MLKKHTLFFSSATRNQIESDPRLLLRPGFVKAMELPGAILRQAKVSSVHVTGDAWSEFRLGASEALLTISAMLLAPRVESTIELASPHGLLANTAQVDIEFFRRGQAGASFVLSFNIDLDSAEMRHVAYRKPGGPGTMVFAA